MLKCPFCQYDNEDGALFCDQCKSDLGILETTTPPPTVHVSEISNGPVAAPAPVAEVSPFEDLVRPVPVATPVGPQPSAPLEAIPVATAVAPARPAPVAQPVEASPRQTSEVSKISEVSKNHLEPPPTVSVPISPLATISSVETYSAPSKTPAMFPVPEPASPPIKDTDVLPTGGKPRLLVLRGQKMNVEYPLYDGDNYIGRADERPVDIDLEDQEPPDRIWSSRQHALIRSENGILSIEDLNSSNGTFVNRTRLYPGQKRVINVNDIIQIGTVQLKVVISP